MTDRTTIFDAPEHGTCPECNSDLVLRDGSFGEFLGCSGWPGCDYTREVEDQHEVGNYRSLSRDADGHWR